MTEENRIVLKPNPEQMAVINELMCMAGTKDLHGAEQKTIYWALENYLKVAHLFGIDKLLAIKGIAEPFKDDFKSKAYKNVAKNAQKSIPKEPINGFESIPDAKNDDPKID